MLPHAIQQQTEDQGMVKEKRRFAACAREKFMSRAKRIITIDGPHPHVVWHAVHGCRASSTSPFEVVFSDDFHIATTTSCSSGNESRSIAPIGDA